MINPNFHKKLFKMFYDLALSVIHRNKLKYKNIKNIEKIKYPKDLKILDDLLLFILKKDKKFIEKSMIPFHIVLHFEVYFRFKF